MARHEAIPVCGETAPDACCYNCGRDIPINQSIQFWDGAVDGSWEHVILCRECYVVLSREDLVALGWRKRRENIAKYGEMRGGG